jgi:arylsulfatase
VIDDLTDKAIRYINTQHAMAPDKPFFMTLAYPGAHSPLHARGRDRDRHKGAYDKGWDVIRAERLGRQRQMGLVPDTTQLPPLSFGADPWDSLKPMQKRVYARYMEVYAGIISNIDDNIGRLVANLETLGLRENTLILIFSDNGGSPEGTPAGTPNVLASATNRTVPLEQANELYDVMGEDATFPHYPMGWACVSNTPFRKYKQYVHLGGVADPLIMNWPAKIKDQGAIRQQFVHVVDLCPTLLDAAGVARAPTYLGRPQKPFEGASFIATFGQANAETRAEQYFELGGTRAIQSGKWRLTANHERGQPFEKDHWELYDTSKEVNELTDLSAQFPDIAAQLRAKWDEAAQRYGVLPLDDRALVLKMMQDKQRRGIRSYWDLRPPVERIAHDVGPTMTGTDHEIEIDLTRNAKDDGVIFAYGSRHAGIALYVKDGYLVYETSMTPWVERITSPSPLPTGTFTIGYKQIMKARPFDGAGQIMVNGIKVAEKKFDRCLMVTTYDGFTIGADLGNQVSSAYKGTNPFQGKIARVQIRVDNRPTNPMEIARFLSEMAFRQ